MENIKLIINKKDYPTANDLISLFSQDSNFSKKTRFVNTSQGNFKVSPENFLNSTWSFTSLETHFESIAETCAAISEILNKKRVQCNAYYTPANAQGLPTHYDLHDVYVYQIEGSKKWNVWPAFRRNVSKETLLLDEKENLKNWTASIDPDEKTLKSFETLFLKAGMPHFATTGNDHSLHLSFGVYND